MRQKVPSCMFCSDIASIYRVSYVRCVHVLLKVFCSFAFLLFLLVACFFFLFLLFWISFYIFTSIGRNAPRLVRRLWQLWRGALIGPCFSSFFFFCSSTWPTPSVWFWKGIPHTNWKYSSKESQRKAFCRECHSLGCHKARILERSRWEKKRKKKENPPTIEVGTRKKREQNENDVGLNCMKTKKKVKQISTDGFLVVGMCLCVCVWRNLKLTRVLRFISKWNMKQFSATV